MLVSLTLELYGFENAEKAVVHVLGLLGKIVKLSRPGAKLFRIFHGFARLYWNAHPSRSSTRVRFRRSEARGRERRRLSAAPELKRVAYVAEFSPSWRSGNTAIPPQQDGHVYVRSSG
jgi:hypothetical protein